MTLSNVCTRYCVSLKSGLGAFRSPNANFTEFLAKSRTVVAGTLVGIGKRYTGVVDNIFDWVIVDETGRATSSELAVAMQVGHRVLLVGDHFQLPPTFSKEVKDTIKQRFGVDDELHFTATLSDSLVQAMVGKSGLLC